PDFTYTNTFASVPFGFPTTVSSVGGAAVYFALHFGSSLMSIFGMAGFAPVNFTFPVIVAPASATGCRVHAAIANVSRLPATATTPTEPSLRIIPPAKESGASELFDDHNSNRDLRYKVFLCLRPRPHPRPRAPRPACPALGPPHHPEPEPQRQRHRNDRRDKDPRRRRLIEGEEVPRDHGQPRAVFPGCAIPGEQGQR